PCGGCGPRRNASLWTSVRSHTASWLKRTPVAQVNPSIDVKSINAHPGAVVRLRPNTLVATLAISTDDPIQGGRCAVALQFLGEFKHCILNRYNLGRLRWGLGLWQWR